MELFLNFLWALIALVALGVWRVCWMREQSTQRRDSVREWAAIVCVLVLLFFVVSLSDDLHSSLALLEESAASRRHSAAWNAGHLSPDSSCPPPLYLVALLTRTISFPLFPNFAPLRISSEMFCTLGLQRFRHGRAPPYSHLDTTV